MSPASRLAVVCIGVLPAAASADVFYFNDFESGVLGPEWSVSARLDYAPAFTTFVGRYSETTPILNNSTSLHLTAPIDDLSFPPTGGGGGGTGGSGGGGTGGGGGGVTFLLRFDLYVIDSWDGSALPAHGPDLFEVYINGEVAFSHTFSNHWPAQSYPLAPDVGPTHLGFGIDTDSIYRNIEVPFTLNGTRDIVIKWRSDGLMGMADESWGIDNVAVAMIPAPSGLAAVAAGLALARRRRR